MKETTTFFIVLTFVSAVFLVAIFGEEIDYAAGQVLKLFLLVPRPLGLLISAFLFAGVVLSCVLISARRHWPVDTEFENDDKPIHNED